MILLRSLIGNNCTKNIHWAISPGSLILPAPLSGHLHSKHVLWGWRWGVMGKVGECEPWGPFSSPAHRTAVSMQTRNPVYLPGCDHA